MACLAGEIIVGRCEERDYKCVPGSCYSGYALQVSAKTLCYNPQTGTTGCRGQFVTGLIGCC